VVRVHIVFPLTTIGVPPPIGRRSSAVAVGTEKLSRASNPAMTAAAMRAMLRFVDLTSIPLS
jgi:hypothetical protein